MRIEFFGKTSTECASITNLVLKHRKHPSLAPLTGFNLPNKVPNDPLLLNAAGHLQASVEEDDLADLKSIDQCLHYSLKYNTGKKSPEALTKFKEFLLCCSGHSADHNHEKPLPLPVKKVLLVSGGAGGGGKQKKQFNTVTCLQALKEEGYVVPDGIQIGIAFNPYWPAPQHKEEEFGRLKAKLATGYVRHIWLNFGSDTKALDDALTALDDVLKSDADRFRSIRLFGSLMVPSKQLLAKFRFRMWSGLFLSEEFMSSVEGAAEVTREIMRIYDKHQVEYLVESAIRNEKDIKMLVDFIKSKDNSPI